MTTLEDVFLQVAEKIDAIKGASRDQKKQQKDIENYPGNNHHDQDDEETYDLDFKEQLDQPLARSNTKEIDQLRLGDIRVKSPGKLFCMQYKAMFKKRLYHFTRAKTALVCEIFVPLILLLLGILFTRV